MNESRLIGGMTYLNMGSNCLVYDGFWAITPAMGAHSDQ
jgi:hypothetical protein